VEKRAPRSLRMARTRPWREAHVQSQINLHPGAVETLPGHGFLGRLAEDVRDALGVDRVTIALADPDEPGMGIVGACTGEPDVLGHHAPLITEPGTGYKSAAEAAALGLCEDADERPWSFAHVPIDNDGDVPAVITLVARRARPFGPRDLGYVAQLARRRVPDFDRREAIRRFRATA
jgi:hypothetical protein